MGPHLASHRSLPKLTLARPLLVLLVGAGMTTACNEQIAPAGSEATQIEAAAAPGPAPLVFPAAYVGRQVADFVSSGDGKCVGRVDTIIRTPAGIAAGGWGWNLDQDAAFEKLLLVDGGGIVIGSGVGGASRPDVPAVVKDVTNPNVGWNATGAGADGSIEVFGLDTTGTKACSIGKADIPARAEDLPAPALAPPKQDPVSPAPLKPE